MRGAEMNAWRGRGTGPGGCKIRAMCKPQGGSEGNFGAFYWRERGDHAPWELPTVARKAEASRDCKMRAVRHCSVSASEFDPFECDIWPPGQVGGMTAQ
eukprot:2260199-Pyramimonas_sp.AAC.1